MEASSVKQVLEKENVTTIDVLKCQDILNMLRTSDQKLMEFLLQPQHIKDIFNILTETFARSDHKRVMQLFQTSNVSLHRIFAVSIPLTEYALEALTKSSDHDMYAAGTISRIFQRAIDLWPDEIYDVFHYSDTLYKTVIENIDKNTVYMTILDSISDEKEFFSELMWYLFLTLVKTSNEKSNSDQIKFEHPPRRCYLSKDLYSELPSFGNDTSKIVNSISILKKYFSLNKPSTEDFGEYVLTFIISEAKAHIDNNTFYHQYFEIAKSIGYSFELQEIAIETIKKAVSKSNTSSFLSLRSPLIISIVSYLEVCAKFLDELTLGSLVVTMIDDQNTQFALLSTVQIVKNATSANPEWFNHFKEIMKQLIACAWNKYHAQQPLIVSILINLSIILYIDEPSSPNFMSDINEWKRQDFILSSVKAQAETFDIDFTFSPSLYDLNELNKLRWGTPF